MDEISSSGPGKHKERKKIFDSSHRVYAEFVQEYKPAIEACGSPAHPGQRCAEQIRPFVSRFQKLAKKVSGRQIELEDLRRWFCWNRYQTDLDVFRLRHKHGDRRATEALVQVDNLVTRWGYGILGADDCRFKTNEHHNAVMYLGIRFGPMEELTAAQLAVEFDQVCPCGRKEPHDAEVLYKLRRVIKRKISEGDTARQELRRLTA